MTMNATLVFMVFFLCVTYKTKTMNATCRPSFLCVAHSEITTTDVVLVVMVFLCVVSSETTRTTATLIVMVFLLCATCKTRTTNCVLVLFLCCKL
jgi:hypothetical protein